MGGSMSRNLVLLSFFTFLGGAGLGVGFMGRGGSDGPTPFTKVAAPKKVFIPLGSPFSSFAYLEKKQSIAYVDSQKRLRFFDLVSGRETVGGAFEGKLHPIVDPFERVLLSDNLRDIKVIKGYSTFKDLRLPISKQFGFWNDGKLWMVKSFKRVSPQKWQLSFFWYSPELNQVGHRNCQVKLNDPFQIVELASHHSAPYFTLYSQNSKQDPSTLITYLVSPKVQKGICRVEEHFVWEGPFQGKIDSLGLMQKNRELVALTSGDKTSLYYSFQKKVFSSQLSSGSPWLLNPSSSVLVNLTAKRGIDIYSLETEKYFTINMIPDRLLVAERQIWVDSSGEHLFISAPIRRNKVGERVLYMISLKKLNE